MVVLPGQSGIPVSVSVLPDLVQELASNCWVTIRLLLRKGRPSRLWRGGSLCAGAQDAQERSHRQGRTKRAAGRRVAIRGSAQKLRRLVDDKHVIHRAIESDHPTKLGVPFETNAFPRSLEGEARRAPRAGTVPLQFRSSAQGAAVRAGNQDAGDAGWTHHAAADVQGGVRVHADIINRERHDGGPWLL